MVPYLFLTFFCIYCLVLFLPLPAAVGPTLGTGSVTTWSLTGKGKLFHSGLPHKAINAIELVHESMRVIQKRFYEVYLLF